MYFSENSYVVDLGELYHNATAVVEEGKSYYENTDRLSHHMELKVRLSAFIVPFYDFRYIDGWVFITDESVLISEIVCSLEEIC